MLRTAPEPLEIVFQPVPSHRGQISAWVTKICSFVLWSIRLCTRGARLCKPELLKLCVDPVQEEGLLWRGEEIPLGHAREAASLGLSRGLEV